MTITNTETCETSAIRLLTRREHSSKELTTKLLQKNYSIEEINLILQKLQANNLQSDVRFANMYAKHRAEAGFGPIRITYDLRDKGIKQETIANALNLYITEYMPWNELAYKVKCKKFGSSIPPKYSMLHKKQQQFLYNRGFTTSQIEQVFTEHLDC